EPKKPKIAVFDFTGCEGCELQLVNKEETVIDFLHAIEVINFRETTLVGKGRPQDVALARQVAMYLVRELTGASLVSIGLHFAGRDHSTVIHACRTIEKKMEEDPVLRARVDTIYVAGSFHDGN
ncbi:MAG: hypothetical protein HWN51_05415, partial [Desulfobacterales bacterium]|nr:hypothetical protein [Desulfobacterales bacterium]